VPGDDIVGFISKGQGVKVHRADCPNIKNETQRLIDVIWDDAITEARYDVKLYITAQDRSFLVSDLVTVLSQSKAGMNSINSSVLEDKITAITNMTIVVNNAEHLKTVIANLKKVPNVISVERSIK
jgi:GTP pyrophosphokinase